MPASIPFGSQLDIDGASALTSAETSDDDLFGTAVTASTLTPRSIVMPVSPSDVTADTTVTPALPAPLAVTVAMGPPVAAAAARPATPWAIAVPASGGYLSTPAAGSPAAGPAGNTLTSTTDYDASNSLNEQLSDDETFGTTPAATNTAVTPADIALAAALGPPTATVSAVVVTDTTPTGIGAPAAQAPPAAATTATGQPGSATAATSIGEPTVAAATLTASQPDPATAAVASGPPAAAATGTGLPQPATAAITIGPPAGTAVTTGQPQPATAAITLGPAAAAATTAGQPQPAAAAITLGPATVAAATTGSAGDLHTMPALDAPAVTLQLLAEPDGQPVTAQSGDPATTVTVHLEAHPDTLDDLIVTSGAPHAAAAATGTDPEPATAGTAIGAPAAQSNRALHPQDLTTAVATDAPRAATTATASPEGVDTPAAQDHPAAAVVAQTTPAGGTAGVHTGPATAAAAAAASPDDSGVQRADADFPILDVVEVDGVWVYPNRILVALGDPYLGVDKTVAADPAETAVLAGGTATVVFTAAAATPDGAGLPARTAAAAATFGQDPAVLEGLRRDAVTDEPVAVVRTYLFARPDPQDPATVSLDDPAATFTQQPAGLDGAELVLYAGDTITVGFDAGDTQPATGLVGVGLGGPVVRYVGQLVSPLGIAVAAEAVAVPLLTYSALGTARYVLVRRTDRRYQVVNPY
ncbi:MAG: hypothetical protein ABWY93_18865 [Mycobacterium sp.]